jgi:hypothetical protein
MQLACTKGTFTQNYRSIDLAKAVHMLTVAYCQEIQIARPPERPCLPDHPPSMLRRQFGAEEELHCSGVEDC